MIRSSREKKITKVLSEFNEMVNANLTTVTIHEGDKNITRKATNKDRLEFIEDQWDKVLESLDEMKINI